MSSILPSAEFLKESGSSGNMVYDLPFRFTQELGIIFRVMNTSSRMSSSQVARSRLTQASKISALSLDQQVEELSKLVKDVGVSLANLEEVFMYIT
mmetsp:Transcript_16469/g.27963  ORF Transcript_16469/g.27963 Transcript_16469/m.27963 type:complete len:96 (+) Transcript_16469:2729-3016(+)